MDSKTTAMLENARVGSHIVYPYTDEARVVSTVGHYVSGGLSHGDAVILILSENHRERVIDYLKADTFAVERLESSGQLAFLDAIEMLDLFMVGGLPDAERFRSLIGKILERASRDVATGRHRHIRMFGEMVSLLWRSGNHDAALRLEQLWNEAIEGRPICLLCTYELDGNGHSRLPGDLIDAHSVCISDRALTDAA